jgi:hypothetical protein
MNGFSEILMPLLNEGTESWRLVAATPLGAELFRVESVCDADEQWQFPSGSVVRCVAFATSLAASQVWPLSLSLHYRFPHTLCRTPVRPEMPNNKGCSEG